MLVWGLFVCFFFASNIFGIFLNLNRGKKIRRRKGYSLYAEELLKFCVYSFIIYVYIISLYIMILNTAIDICNTEHQREDFCEGLDTQVQSVFVYNAFPGSVYSLVMLDLKKGF